jgi:hypothetical protein
MLFLCMHYPVIGSIEVDQTGLTIVGTSTLFIETNNILQGFLTLSSRFLEDILRIFEGLS